MCVGKGCSGCQRHTARAMRARVHPAARQRPLSHPHVQVIRIHNAEVRPFSLMHDAQVGSCRQPLRQQGGPAEERRPTMTTWTPKTLSSDGMYMLCGWHYLLNELQGQLAEHAWGVYTYTCARLRQCAACAVAGTVSSVLVGIYHEACFSGFLPVEHGWTAWTPQNGSQLGVSSRHAKHQPVFVPCLFKISSPSQRSDVTAGRSHRKAG